MRPDVLICAAAALIFAASVAHAQTEAGSKSKDPAAKGPAAVPAEQVKWGPPPRGVVHGRPSDEFAGQPPAGFAILSGNPARAGAPFTVRLKCNDGYRVAPHWHPATAHVTVLQGTLVLARGNKWDTGGEALSAGSYAIVPGKMATYGSCKGDTIVQVHGSGPFRIHFVGAERSRSMKDAN